jgi:hypothetical protein
MINRVSRLLLGLCLLLLPAALLAQQSAPSMDQSGMSNGNSQSVTATGCLQKGSEAGGYYLTGDDGKTWELTGKGLSANVGHKITVTGQEMQGSKAQEAKVESSEKTEAGTNQHGDLRVSNVQMVSASCQ